MRFLHTSDWHLGRGLSGWSLLDEQRHATNFIVDQAIARSVDVLVIAGDVYDLQRPAVEDILHLREVLTRLHAAGIKVIITAGNHDSGPRLAANSNLLIGGFHIAGLMQEAGHGIEFADKHGPVVFYPLPYLEPNEARLALSADRAQPLERSHQAVMAAAMARVSADLATRPAGTRAVAIAHAFVVKGTETDKDLAAEQSDSERDLSVGGVQTVKSDVFKGVDYVALGHLHGPREVGVVGNDGPVIRYSGSILRYSLSEAKHEKSFVIVQLGDPADSRRCEIEVVPIPQLRGMARLEGTVAELLSPANAKHFEDYVELTVTENLAREDYYGRLAAKYQRIITAKPQRPTGLGDHPGDEPVGITTHSPVEIMQRFYEESSGKKATDEVMSLLREAYEQVRHELEQKQ